MENRLKVLGSVSPYCKGNCNCPGYLLEIDNNKILLDCGSGVTRQLNLPGDLNNLVIIISHYHKDHYSDLFSLGYASYCYHKLGMLDKKIKLFLPKVNVGETGYDDYKLITGFNENYFDIEFYDENSLINYGGNVISFCEVSHSIPCYSCKIQNSEYSLVYTGDMGYRNLEKYIDFCRDADFLISESTYLKSDNCEDVNHLHAFESANIAKMANVQTLMLTHFWPEHNKLEYLNEAIEIFGNTIVAEEGAEINLYNRKNNLML